MPPLWRPEDIRFRLDGNLTDGPVMTFVIVTPVGAVLVMGEPTSSGPVLNIRRSHVQAQDRSPMHIGTANLLMIVRAAMEEFGYDGIILEGAVRTTGANPGRTPRVLRFTRVRGDDHTAG
jgi:hypothetical protein